MNGTIFPVKRFLHMVLFLTFWILIFLNLPNLCYANHNHQHGHHHEQEESPSFKYSKEANEPHRDRTLNYDKVSDESWSVWTQALTSTLLISAAPFFILFFVPLDRSKEKESLLKILLSFASGGLLGDAFLHLIPHALTPSSHKTHDKGSHMSHSESHDHEHDQEHGHDMGVGFFVLLGILIFLVVEKSVRLVNTGHGHSHTASFKNSKKETNDKGDCVVKKNETSQKESKKGNSKKEKKKGVISASGYLNLAADFTHNLTDGLAIGASYLAGKNIGIITTITILLHEVPHEIGDFAILIQSGCSRRKAMCLQLVTAVGAVMGTLISLMAEGVGNVASSWILPFTAGGFIYISTVSIIPELLEDSKFVQSIKEILAMLVGVLLMVVIADIE